MKVHSPDFAAKTKTRTKNYFTMLDPKRNNYLDKKSTLKSLIHFFV
jgi:hypothetical protein